LRDSWSEPVATPALIWLALVLEPPLVAIIALLIVVVSVSNRLSHNIIRACGLSEASGAGSLIGYVAAS
jgi:hypothetical protein